MDLEDLVDPEDLADLEDPVDPVDLTPWVNLRPQPVQKTWYHKPETYILWEAYLPSLQAIEQKPRTSLTGSKLTYASTEKSQDLLRL